MYLTRGLLGEIIQGTNNPKTRVNSTPLWHGGPKISQDELKD